MAIAYDVAAPATVLQGSGSSLTSAAFSVGAGSDRALFGFSMSADGSLAAHNAMKWRGSGGSAMTQIGSYYDVAAQLRLSAWRLVAPTSANDTLYGSWAAAQAYSAIAGAAYSGVDQVAPAGGLSTNNGTVSNNFGFNTTVNVTTVAGDVVLAFTVVLDGNGNTPILTPGGTPAGTGRTESENSIVGVCVQEVVATGTTTTVTCGVAPTTGNISGTWAMLAFVIGASVPQDSELLMVPRRRVRVIRRLTV